MTPAVIPLIQNVGLEIQRAKNKHQFRSIVYAFMAIFNIVISIFLAKEWAEIGTAIGTTISLVVANGFIMNIYYHKKLGINILKFWGSILKTFKGLIIPILYGVIVTNIFKINSIGKFVIFAGIYCVLYAVSVYFLGCNKDEKNLVNGILHKILRHPRSKKANN